MTRSLWPLPQINTSAILHLNEDTVLNTDQVKSCYYMCNGMCRDTCTHYVSVQLHCSLCVTLG